MGDFCLFFSERNVYLWILRFYKAFVNIMKYWTRLLSLVGNSTSELFTRIFSYLKWTIRVLLVHFLLRSNLLFKLNLRWYVQTQAVLNSQLGISLKYAMNMGITFRQTEGLITASYCLNREDKSTIKKYISLNSINILLHLL